MSRFSGIISFMTPDEMCVIGTWTLCTSVRYSVIPALKAGRAPDPKKLLLLADEGNPLVDSEATNGVAERRLESDGIDSAVLEAYLRQVPPENIYWLDQMNRDHLDLAVPMDGHRLQFKSTMKEVYYAYLQYQWLLKHQDGAVAFSRYLRRLGKVVAAYMASEYSGPAWDSLSGYQWDPLRAIPPLVMAEAGQERWEDPHPLQVSRAALFGED